MSRPPVIVRTFPKLVSTLDALRGRRNATVALVPTMGALHDGHLALVAKGHELADKVVVSIFVNPTQFAPTEDFGAYPRTFASDRAKLTKAGCDVIWNPTPAMMYPEGFASRVHTEGPATAGLEDRFRPHFFGGVATVVAKLFTQVRPEIAVFGQKDYQQLLVVTQMARDLDLRVKVVGLPTVREADGLAMSSRNIYLSIEDRARAPILHRALMTARKRIRAGDEIAVAVREAAKTIAVAGFVIDYVEARHGQTLAPIAARSEGPVRLLVAARRGSTRLLDNVAV